MVSRAALVSKAFGKSGALATIADASVTAENRKITSDSMAEGATGMKTVTAFSELAGLADMKAGDNVLVTNTDKLYIYDGVGWYLIATITNQVPGSITGVDATYELATDGTATVITASSVDPEGFPLTWSYAVSTGSLGSTATVTQANNVFTITPSSTEADAGSFSLTFNVNDGVNASVSYVSAFTLSFAYEFTNNTAPQISSGSILPASEAYSSYFDPNPLPLGRHYFEVTFSNRPTAQINFVMTRLESLYTTQGGSQDPTSPTYNIYWAGHLGVQLNHPNASGNGGQAGMVGGKAHNTSSQWQRIFSAGPTGTVYGNWWEYDARHIFGYRLMVAYDTGNWSGGGNRGASIYYGLNGSWGVNFGGSGGSGNTPPSGGITLDPNTQTNPQGGWSSMPNGITGHSVNGYTYYTDSDPFYIGIDRDAGVATSTTFTIHRGSSECNYSLPTNYSYL